MCRFCGLLFVVFGQPTRGEREMCIVLSVKFLPIFRFVYLLSPRLCDVHRIVVFAMRQLSSRKACITEWSMREDMWQEPVL